MSLFMLDGKLGGAFYRTDSMEVCMLPDTAETSDFIMLRKSLYASYYINYDMYYLFIVWPTTIDIFILYTKHDYFVFFVTDCKWLS